MNDSIFEMFKDVFSLGVRTEQLNQLQGEQPKEEAYEKEITRHVGDTRHNEKCTS